MAGERNHSSNIATYFPAQHSFPALPKIWGSTRSDGPRAGRRFPSPDCPTTNEGADVDAEFRPYTLYVPDHPFLTYRYKVRLRC